MWSASHGCVRTDRRPVSTTPSVSGSRTNAPSNGCATVPTPAEPMSPAADPLVAFTQNGCRWKA